MRLACCLSLLALAWPAGAEDRNAVIDRTVATLDRVQSFEEVAISPDGARVAYVQHDAGVFVVPAAGGAPVRVTAAAAAATAAAEETDIAWSPDSRQLAFVSDARGRRPALYVAGPDGSGVRPLTTAAGAFSHPRFSPDGRRVAVLMIENGARKGGALEAMAAPTGDVDAQVEERRIAVVDLASRDLQLVTPADTYVYDYDWSPDGRSLVVEAALGSGEANYWVARLYRFDLGDPAGRVLYAPPLHLANPRWSPDGARIAFLEGLMSDEGQNGGDVMVMPATGGAPTNVTPGLRATVTSFEWLPGGTDLLAGENVAGLSGFARVSAAGGSHTPLWSGPEETSTGHVIGASVARDGVTTAVVRESYEHPPEIAAGPIGRWAPVTRVNAATSVPWGRAESVEWTNEGQHVQGWLLYPKAAEPGRKLPLIVEVHGGPSSGALNAWPSLRTAVLTASGYAVLKPNPRGSYGQGEAFVQANVKDFGRGDFRDILAGVDAAVAKGGLDPARVGIWGWSYGGYMTMWAVTQTNRFRAAVAGAGIVNWESYYGQNAISTWMIPFFGASVYDDPWIYRRSAPIEYIKQVKTPTLVLVGDSDGEVPSPQSFEFWRALKTLGVKTKLVVYPGEGHKIEKPEHVRDLSRRLVGWFDDNL